MGLERIERNGDTILSCAHCYKNFVYEGETPWTYPASRCPECVKNVREGKRLGKRKKKKSSSPKVILRRRQK